MSNKTQSHPISSYLTVTTLLIGVLAVLVLPDGFSSYPASYKSLAFFACTLVIFAYFLVTAFRRKKLYLNLSPLTFSLAIFAFFTLLSILVNNFSHSTVSFLGFGGLLLAFAVLAVFSSTLIKINNNQVIIRSLLAFCTFSTLTTIIYCLNSFFSFLPTSLVASFYAPGLNLSLMIIGLAAVSANFFKKNKFKGSFLAFIPVFAIGLIVSLFLDFQASPVTPSFARSLSTAVYQLTNNGRLDTRSLFLGSQAQNYADIFDQFGSPTVSELSSYTQACAAPLTMLSLYGCLAAIAWLILVCRTVILCFDTREANRDLYFILLVSFFVQLFTSIHPLILIIQAILIAFATNKNRQILINFNLATFSSEKSDQTVENRDHSRFILLSFSTIATLLLIFISFNLVRNYQGFRHYEASLAAITEENVNDFADHALAAVNFAPGIDYINRAAASVYVESMYDYLGANDEAASQAVITALDYAQHAIDVAPQHAANYYFRAKLLQEAYQFADEAERAENASRIVSAYTTATLYQPTNPDNLLALGGFYQDLGQYEYALIAYQSAIKLDENYAQTHYQLGTLYEAQGDTDLAIQSYTHALQLLDSDSSDYTYVQAKIDGLAS